jgi:hypothetical protein
MPDVRSCFVVMPFLPEFNFFYLYLQYHLRERHGLHVERGDHKKLTIPILEKIKQSINEADVVIGDMTGRNPNVFYELGLADALSKPVILLTQDEVRDVPTDVRHFEIIKYELSNPQRLLSDIDNAIHHLLFAGYKAHYDLAMRLLTEFNQAMGVTYGAATVEEFQTRVIREAMTQPLPAPDDSVTTAEFLLLKIINDITITSVI